MLISLQTAVSYVFEVYFESDGLMIVNAITNITSYENELVTIKVNRQKKPSNIYQISPPLIFSIQYADVAVKRFFLKNMIIFFSSNLKFM